MRLVGCLLLPTDIRACLYEPGMGEGRVKTMVQARSRTGEAHNSWQPARPLVMVETSGRHSVVHSYRLVRQHCHLTLSYWNIQFDSIVPNISIMFTFIFNLITKKTTVLKTSMFYTRIIVFLHALYY